MTLRQSIVLFLSLGAIASLIACSSSSTNPVTGNSPDISIAATGGNGQSATVGKAFANPLVATVTSNGSPASGASVSFTAPSSGPSCIFANNKNTETDPTNANGVATSTPCTANTTAGSYSIGASTSGTSAKAAFSLTNNSGAPSTLAAGSYVFSLTGTDNSPNGPSPYWYAGVFTVNSQGAITTGEQDFSDFTTVASKEAITGGSVTPNPADGNLLVTLKFTDSYINNGAGSVTLDASLVSSSKGLLIEYDTWASSSGELDLQSTSLPAPSEGYAFFDAGWTPNLSDPTTALPFSLGGVINVDSAGAISGTGSIFDLNDSGNGILSPEQPFTTSSVSGPDASGFVTFTLNPGVSSGVPQIILEGYMVDSGHIRLVENWQAELSASPPGFGSIAGGTALAQTGIGAFNAISGSYIFSMSGFDNNSNGSLGPDQVAGVLAFNADSSVTGNASFNDQVSANPPQGGNVLMPETTACASGTAKSPCYTIDGPGVGADGGTGRVTLTNVTDNSTFHYALQLYLTGDGEALVISMDSSDWLAGPAEQQASQTFPTGSFSGNYAINIAEPATNTSGTPVEADAVGVITANGTTGSLNGFLDENPSLLGLPLAPNTAISASDAATSTNGVFVMTPPGTSGTKFTGYFVDDTQGFFIENDLGGLSLGYFDQQ